MNLMMAESPPHPGDEEQELQSNDEAHDRLGDLPFNGGGCLLGACVFWFAQHTRGTFFGACPAFTLCAAVFH